MIIVRNDSEPGCVVVCGASQMLPLAKRYFYQSLNKYERIYNLLVREDIFISSILIYLSSDSRVIRENETKHATWVTNCVF